MRKPRKIRKSPLINEKPVLTSWENGQGNLREKSYSKMCTDESVRNIGDMKRKKSDRRDDLEK